ncbi:MAG: HAD-IA family hydrolase [Candidatus Bathyarchaeia archaeon]
MVRIKAVIFDLDNVLYDERTYVDVAYCEIARFLASICRLSEQVIYKKLLDELHKKTSMYPRLFNDVLLDLDLDVALLPEILKIYAQVTPNLRTYPGIKKLLRVLRKKRVKLALVTNGCVEIQRNKIKLLKLEKYFDVILFAREVAASLEKPNPQVYIKALELLGTKAEETLCVGDNPHTDFWGAKKLGMRTIRLLIGEFKFVKMPEEYEAERSVHSIDELINLFLNSNNTYFGL